MNSRRFRDSQGSAFITAAIAAGILAILVVSFLAFMGNEYYLNFRSHRWNQAMHLAEAGVEIGFAEFNYQYYQGGNSFQSAHGWTDLGGGAYTKIVSNFTDTANRSVGNITVTVGGVGSASPSIMGVGGCSTLPRGPSVSRAVKVVLAPSTRFPAGVVARGTINLNGNNAYSDSFDSTDPAKSTGGFYDFWKRQPHGDIATDTSLINSINIGNADVFGLVSTGPGGTISMGPNGVIGPSFSNPATDIATAEANGWARHDFNVDIPDPVLPSGADAWVNVGNVGNQTLSSGDYQASQISVQGNSALTIVGNVRIYVTGTIGIAGNGKVLITSGSSLTVYVAGSASIAGNGVQTTSGLARNNMFYGLSSCTDFSIQGNGSWIGTVYAPRANLTVGGNGSFSGAVVADAVTLAGNARFHYDESLKTTTADSYLVASWQELKLVSGVWQ